MQVPVPEQPPPLQPVNCESLDGVAVNVTDVPLSKLEDAVEQEDVQLMPVTAAPPAVPLAATAPVPVLPVFATVMRYWAGTKLAPTVAAPDRDTLHVPKPLHAPLQPLNTETTDDVEFGVAVSVTVDPSANCAEHELVVQLIPLGVLVTVPEAAPLVVRFVVRVSSWVNVAVTLTAIAPTVTLQVPVPLH